MKILELKPPMAERIKKVNKYNDDEIIDYYYWLREKQNPKVIEYLNAENEYTKAMMEHTKPLQDEIYNELVTREKEDDESVPEKIDNYYYYKRIEKGKNNKIYCRKKDSLDAPEEIILDVNKLAEGKKYCSLGNVKTSPNHKYIAYTADYFGNEKYVLYVKDLETSKEKEIKIENLAHVVIWGNDSKSVFYQKKDKIDNPNLVFSHDNIHKFEDSNESLIFHEKRTNKYLSVYKTKDKKYLFFNSGSKDSTEIFFYDLEEKQSPSQEIVNFVPEKKNVLMEVTHNNGYFYVLTNEDAINFKIMRVKAEFYADKTKWEEFLPHNEKLFVFDIEMFKNYIVVHVRKNGLKNIMVYTISEKKWHDIEFEDELYSINDANVPANYEFDTDILRFEYSSLNIPSTIIDYDMSTRKKEIKKVYEVFNFDKDNYITERGFAKAEDGTNIPVSIIYHKDIKKDGNNKAMLYGYGSYGYAMDPSFMSYIISLLDRGFVYAIAHIRGGSELGWQWYLDGKYLKKKNTFTDFIACAKYLCSNGYTTAEKLSIRGGSAGGLLIGAVINIEPELCKVAILDVPFVDVINTMMDATIPLTTLEYEEWGDPNEIEYYKYMKSYSPYDNLKPEKGFKYPHILVTAGLNDPRVQYWEPAKYVAKLRTLKNEDGNKLLLKTNMGAGHRGLSGKYEYLKEVAFRYAFLIDSLNELN
jgi:oligopeptidase B